MGTVGQILLLRDAYNSSGCVLPFVRRVPACRQPGIPAARLGGKHRTTPALSHLHLTARRHAP